MIARLVTPRLVKLALAALLLVEGVFLAESLQTLLETVIRYGGSTVDVLGILLLTAPEIFDFALPLALLIGTYAALVTAREDGEFVISSSAGIPWKRIPGFVIVAGVAGFAVSLAFAGFIGPQAATAKRLWLFDLQARQVRQQITEPGQRDELHGYQGWTFIATAAREAGELRGRLFVRHPDEAGGRRITQADDWDVHGPDAEGSFAVVFKQVTDYALDNPPAVGTRPRVGTDPAVEAATQVTAISADSAAMPIRLEKIISEVDRLRQDNEAGFAELVAQLTGRAVQADPDLQRRAAELFGRAILCPIACLFALLAVLHARAGLARYAALPLAGTGMLAFDTVSRALLGIAAPSGLVMLVAAGSLLFALAALPLLALVFGHGEKMIVPADSRA